MLIRANAELIAVKGGGSSEDYGQAEGEDADKWTGSVPCLVEDEIGFERAGEGANEITRTVARIPAEIDVDLDLNDSIVYVQDDVTHTRGVETVVPQKLVGVVRLTLADV